LRGEVTGEFFAPAALFRQVGIFSQPEFRQPIFEAIMREAQ